jgi:hypothetical protein
MSVCNLIARIFVIGAPIISEQPGNLPMTVYTCACAVGIFMSILLSEEKGSTRR